MPGKKEKGGKGRDRPRYEVRKQFWNDKPGGERKYLEVNEDEREFILEKRKQKEDDAELMRFRKLLIANEDLRNPCSLNLRTQNHEQSQSSSSNTSSNLNLSSTAVNHNNNQVHRGEFDGFKDEVRGEFNVVYGKIDNLQKDMNTMRSDNNSGFSRLEQLIKGSFNADNSNNSNSQGRGITTPKNNDNMEEKNSKERWAELERKYPIETMNNLFQTHNLKNYLEKDDLLSMGVGLQDPTVNVTSLRALASKDINRITKTINPTKDFKGLLPHHNIQDKLVFIRCLANELDTIDAVKKTKKTTEVLPKSTNGQVPDTSSKTNENNSQITTQSSGNATNNLNGITNLTIRKQLGRTPAIGSLGRQSSYVDEEKSTGG